MNRASATVSATLTRAPRRLNKGCQALNWSVISVASGAVACMASLTTDSPGPSCWVAWLALSTVSLVDGRGEATHIVNSPNLLFVGPCRSRHISEGKQTVRERGPIFMDMSSFTFVRRGEIQSTRRDDQPRTSKTALAQIYSDCAIDRSLSHHAVEGM
jgi:hypothetical protein